jgi:CubicO group peptidase (beta-lactamase class C family)
MGTSGCCQADRMGTLTDVSQWISGNLPSLIERYEVPGAAVAVLAGDDVVEHAAGVLSMSTGVEATPDSVFQIGSITKLWTSSLVMQLVDEGEVDLDATVRTYLPEFRIADEDAAGHITIRQLLIHTSGFEGDVFTDTGVGDDCVEKFLGVLHDVPQLFPPGSMWSYNNAGFSVLGRLVEVLRGKPYDACLRKYLIEPLGITHAATSPYEAILFRAAVGHIETAPGAGLHPTPVWALVRSNIAAGSMFAMSPRGLLAFARMHLDDGRAADGSQVLARGTAARMHDKEVELPYLGYLGSSWGLGFERFDTPGGTIIGHDGGTIGQSAYLRIVPAAGVAVALLTNGGNTGPLFRDVVGHAIDALANVALPPEPVPSADPARIDASRYVGTYSCDVATVVISQHDDGAIWMDAIPTGALAEELGEQAERWELVSFTDDTLITRERDHGLHRPYAFLDDDGTGHAKYLHVGRALTRADGSGDAAEAHART